MKCIECNSQAVAMIGIDFRRDSFISTSVPYVFVFVCKKHLENRSETMKTQNRKAAVKEARLPSGDVSKSVERVCEQLYEEAKKEYKYPVHPSKLKWEVLAIKLALAEGKQLKLDELGSQLKEDEPNRKKRHKTLIKIIKERARQEGAKATMNEIRSKLCQKCKKNVQTVENGLK